MTAPSASVALRQAEALLYAGRDHDAEAVCAAAFGDRAAPHLGRLRILVARAKDPAATAGRAELDATIARMMAELARQPLYQASEFWTYHGSHHLQLLQLYGLEHFKRTVSHTYQNWFITSPDDPQLRAMLAQWPRHNSVEPLLNEIETPSHVGYHSQGFEYLLAEPEPRAIYKLAVGLIWEFVRAGDRAGLLDMLEEPEIGDPIRITRRGRLISSDLAHSVRERNLLLETCGWRGDEGLCIAELGAGHGRLADVFGRSTNYRYVIFDIPPALYVSQWYVKRLFPDARVFEFRPFDRFDAIADELAASRFAFFTANQIEAFPDGAFDGFINMNSLMEMRREQIVGFLGHIGRLTRSAFLSRQWLEWHNPRDGHTVRADDFALGPPWRKALDVVDEIYPELFNQVWVRR